MIRCVSILSVLRFMFSRQGVEWCIVVIGRCYVVAVADIHNHGRLYSSPFILVRN